MNGFLNYASAVWGWLIALAVFVVIFLIVNEIFIKVLKKFHLDGNVGYGYILALLATSALVEYGLYLALINV